MTTIGRFSLVQFAAQGVMAWSGLLIVRNLSKHEYALFLVANTMQGTMNILADAGATIGMTTLGGQVWQDRNRLGQLVNSTLSVRRKMMVASVFCCLPLLMWLLYRNGATIPKSILISIVTLASLYFLVGANVSRVVLQFHSRIGRLQKIDLGVPVARLAFILAASLLFLDATLAIAVMTLVWAAQWWQLDRWAADEADPVATVNPEYVKFIRTKIRQVLPGSIFLCLQGQIYIFILSLYGKSDRLAEVGALSRLAVFFAVVMTVMHSLVIPAFARCQNLATLRRRYFQIIVGFIVLAIALLSVAGALPGPLLWILGRRYTGLQQELVLSIAVTAVSGLGDAMWLLNGAKGWTQNSWIGIPLQLLLQIVLFFYLDVQTVRGVLTFSLISLLPPMSVSGALAIRGLFGGRATAVAA